MATKKPPKRLVLLTPGAGSSSTHSSLLAIDSALVAAGTSTGVDMIVHRMDFPYRLAGRRTPDRAPVCIAAIVDTIGELMMIHSIKADQIVLGGRSMGGRMCSMAIAEGLAARALFCVSYPLHPPGRPDNLRVQHFPLINVATLFVSGTRDAFGTPDEFATHTRQISGPFTHEWLLGGDHGLAKCEAAAASLVAEWVIALR